MKLPSYQALSKEQDRINSLPLDGRFLVTGPPGTGKTVMALYRASLLKRSRRASKILMYSRLLSQYTASAVSELLLDGSAETYHRWFFGFFCSTYRQRPPQVSKFHYDFGQALKIIVAAPPQPGTVPDLIVDEGQDLPKEFYALTRILTQNVAVFADENQRITDQQSTIREIRAFGGFDDPVRLTRNYRNTREIAALAAHFYTGLATGIPDPPERSGEVPVMRHYSSPRDAIDTITVFERNNPNLEIGVFVPNRDVQQRIVKGLDGRTRNPVQFYLGGQGARGPTLSFDRPGITVVNYPSAKGLEFDAVFIPEIQDMAGDLDGPDPRMRLYVLISRAREYLEVSYSGSGDPASLRLFPRQLLEWR